MMGGSLASYIEAENAGHRGIPAPGEVIAPSRLSCIARGPHVLKHFYINTGGSHHLMCKELLYLER
jgi:hypothetical protein